MITPIASRYANALMHSAGDSLDDIANALSKVSLAFNIEKTEHIIGSSSDNKQVVDLLLQIGGNSDKKFSNFLYILAQRQKLHILPQISNALALQISSQNNSYVGYVYSKENIQDDMMSQLEKNISKKVEKNIELIYRKSDFNGIRIDIEMLNIEISFSKNQIKNKLLDSILKSI